MTWFHLALGSLACFRLSVLFSQDTGPAHVFSKLRSALKKEAKTNATLRKSDVHRGIDCLRCSSIWMALPIAAYVVSGWRSVWVDGLLWLLALSGAAILWSRAFPQR